jgi:Protein of unknown function (DUF2442)
MKITDDVLEAANQRATEKKATFPSAISVRYDRRISRVVIALDSGLEVAFSQKLPQGLEHAHPADLSEAEISPSGLGIHFHRLDAYIYLPTLLEGFLVSRSWMAAERGKKRGETSTEAKVAAARQNGKLGGRPRKVKALVA